MFEAGLYYLLANDPGIQAAVGIQLSPPVPRADATSGIWPALLPEHPILPAIAYQIVAATSVDSCDGTNALEMKRVQIDCHAKTYAGAKALSAAVKDCLLGYLGILNDGSEISGVLPNGEYDRFEDAPAEFAVTLDFSIWVFNV